MSKSVTWRTVLDNFANVFYESQSQKVPHKTEHGMSGRVIGIIALVSLFAFVIFCLILAIVCKWVLMRRKQDANGDGKRQEEKLTAESLDPFKEPDQPRHVNLMHSDSSLSEVEVSRDSSFPPTPMSPLSEEDPAVFPFERGRLEFSICYDPENECLKTTIIQAHGLPQRHCIFLVEGMLFPDRTNKQKTSIRYHNPSPIFEESLQFYLPFSELPERTLRLEVVELDNFSQQTVVGNVLYSFDMDNCNYASPLNMDLELNESLPQDKVNQEPVGELLMSLCYLPTAGRLTLVVLKCRLFQASSGLPSPFLKVSLVLNRKQVKKIKTSVKSKTLNPVYNEAFIFDVPAKHISNVGLYARVVNEREEQEMIGKVVIGPTAKTSMGVHHWDCMIMSPRKPIAQWHSIASYKK